MDHREPGWKLLDSDGEPMDRSEGPVQRTFATGAAHSTVVGLERPDASCTNVSQQREVELHLTDLAQRDSRHPRRA